MKKNLKHSEVVKRGGQATFSKYGREYFSKLGKKSAKVKLRRFGTDYYKHLSELGVAARKEKKNKNLIQKVVEVINPPKDKE